MKKIMFNDKYGLTQAVLEGLNTNTRRIIPTNLYNRVDWKAFEEGNYDCVITDDASAATDIRDYAAYRVGEVVAVAQSYKDAGCDFYFHAGLAGWRNKMFVKANEMPHRIRITNVRVERLQDISEEDSLKEGVFEIPYSVPFVLNPNSKGYAIDYEKVFNFKNRQRFLAFTSSRQAFAALIDKTCGKGTWDSNPWVFVYDFELIR